MPNRHTQGMSAHTHFARSIGPLSHHLPTQQCHIMRSTGCFPGKKPLTINRVPTQHSRATHTRHACKTCQHTHTNTYINTPLNPSELQENMSEGHSSGTIIISHASTPCASAGPHTSCRKPLEADSTAVVQETRRFNPGQPLTTYEVRNANCQ